MKTAIHISLIVLGFVVLIASLLIMAIGAEVHHNDKMVAGGGYASVMAIIGISLLRILWTGKKHKHQNAVHFRTQKK